MVAVVTLRTSVILCSPGTLVPLLYMASMQSMCRVWPHLTNFPTVLGRMFGAPSVADGDS